MEVVFENDGPPLNPRLDPLELPPLRPKPKRFSPPLVLEPLFIPKLPLDENPTVFETLSLTDVEKLSNTLFETEEFSFSPYASDTFASGERLEYSSSSPFLRSSSCSLFTGSAINNALYICPCMVSIYFSRPWTNFSLSSSLEAGTTVMLETFLHRSLFSVRPILSTILRISDALLIRVSVLPGKLPIKLFSRTLSAIVILFFSFTPM